VDSIDEVDTFSWFAWNDHGVVDRVDSEAIVTHFYRVIIPVWPDHSAYVIRAEDGSEQRIKIPLQRRSVVLGYLRVPTWLSAVVLGSPAVLAPARWGSLLLPALALTMLAAVLTFFAGRLGEPERLRRQLLRRVVGFGAPPELLSEALLLEVRSNLELMWNTRSPGTRWSVAIERGEASELLVALAEYHQDPELIAQAHDNFDNQLWN
jgi:hypothetical protein